MKLVYGSVWRGMCLASVFGLGLTVQALDWPHFRGPEYNGISEETGWQSTWPAEGPKQLWKANVGIGFASVSVADGRAFTTGNKEDKDMVFCLEAETGKGLWIYTYEEPLAAKYYEGGTSATPTVDGDRVYTLSKSGKLSCLQAADGGVVWQQDMAAELGLGKKQVPTWGFASSARILGDRLLLNVGAAGTALNKNTGKVLWTSGKEAGGYSTPVPFTVASVPHVAFFTKEDVVAVTVAEGKELWRYPWKTRYDVNAADPLVFGNKVFISSGYNHGCALLTHSGSTVEKVWENKNLRNMLNSSVVIGDHIYGIDGDGGKRDSSLRCLDVATGSVQWEAPYVLAGSLMAADGKLIVLSEKGELMVAPVSPKEFQPISRAQVLGGKCWTAPVLANGRIYCRNAKGDVVCLDVK